MLKFGCAVAQRVWPVGAAAERLPPAGRQSARVCGGNSVAERGHGWLQRQWQWHQRDRGGGYSSEPGSAAQGAPRFLLPCNVDRGFCRSYEQVKACTVTHVGCTQRTRLRECPADRSPEIFEQLSLGNIQATSGCFLSEHAVCLHPKHLQVLSWQWAQCLWTSCQYPHYEMPYAVSFLVAWQLLLFTALLLWCRTR